MGLKALRKTPLRMLTQRLRTSMTPSIRCWPESEVRKKRNPKRNLKRNPIPSPNQLRRRYLRLRYSSQNLSLNPSPNLKRTQKMTRGTRE